MPGLCFSRFSIAFCFSFIFLSISFFAFPSPQIRVKIAKNSRNFFISSEGKIRVENLKSPVNGKIRRIFFYPGSNYPMRIDGKSYRSKLFVLFSPLPMKVGKYSYRGILKIFADSKRIYVVNQLDLEQYLEGVLPAEVSPKWPIEALKAQAVASRTYALYKKQENIQKRWDLSGEVNDQVYRGYFPTNSKVIRALRETRGEVITYQGKIIPTFYHSNSGGTTEDSKNVWNEPLGYIYSLKVPYGKSDPNYFWKYSISQNRLARSLQRAGYPSQRLKDIEVISRNLSGRVNSLSIVGNHNSSIKGVRLREILGANRIKSTKFSVRKQGGYFVFRGQGYGHGVGMCQWCAKEMAEQGQSYKRILKSFYRGIAVVHLKKS